MGVQFGTELEADQIVTSDYAFRRIGEAVPLKPGDSAFGLVTPPPLPVTVRQGALFLAHSHGFLVARTRDMIGEAKEVKEKGKGEGLCFKGERFVDVGIGRVEIVAVSGDQSTLAVAVGQELRFYSAAALLDKGKVVELQKKPRRWCSRRNCVVLTGKRFTMGGKLDLFEPTLRHHNSYMINLHEEIANQLTVQVLD